MPPLDAFALVIFDCDGVLVDSEALAAAAVAALLTEAGRAIDADEVYERFLGRSFAAIECDYAERCGRALPTDFRARLHNALARVFAQDLRPMPGVDRVITGLCQPFCVASSSDPARLALALAVTGLDRAFAGRVFHAGMVAHGKPAPDLFLHAAEAMGVDPRHCLVIEDSVNGILAAKAAGMTAVGFLGGSHHLGRPAGERLRGAGADALIHAMVELP